MDRMPSLNELRIFHNNVQIPLSQIQEIKNPHDIHSIRQLDQSLNELPHIGVNRSNSINRIMPDYQQIIIEKYKENEHIIREFIKCKNNESTTNDGNCNHDNRFILIDRNEFTALFKIEDVMLIDLIFHHFQYNDKSRATDRFTSTNNNNSNNNNNHHSNNINNSNSNNKHNISKNNLKDIITTNNVITTNNNNSNNIDNNNNNGNIVSCQDDKPSQSFINNYMSSSVESHNSALSSDTSSFSDSNNNNSKINILKRPIAGSFPIETPSFYNIPLQNTDSSQPTSLTNSPLEEQCNFTSTADNTPTIENNLNNIIENNNNNNNDNDNIDDNNNDDNDNDEDDDIENSSGSSSNNISSNISSSDSSNDDHNKSITTEQDNNNNNNNNSTINNDDVDINKNNKNNKQSSTKKDNKLFKKKAKKEKEKEKDKEKITSYVNLFDIINQIYLIMSNRGTKEDRIKSAFNLYDIYNRGFINRVDLKNVLAFRIKQNGLSISDMTLENLVDNVFEQFDKNKDGIIDFQEFQQEMLSIKDNEPTTKPIEQKKTTQGVKTYFNIEGIKLIYILMIILMNVGITVWTYFVVSNSFLALHLFGNGLYVTRIAAGTIRFNASFILLTMCKQIFTWIRNTRIRSLVPVDKYLTFHKIFALFLVLASLVHTVGWFFGMGIASTKPDYVFFSCMFPHFTARPTVWAMIFLSVPGITGFLMLAILIVMLACSFKSFRKRFFEGFYYTHHIFILFYILLIVHGSQGWISPPSFWKWFIGPAALYMLDRGFRLCRKTHRVSIVNFSLKNSKVINLTFSRPSSFNYKPGQYLLVNVPQISKLQWHPFTMTSSPLQDHISVHIRVTGGWTKSLFDYLSRKQTNDALDLEVGAKDIEINIDGPFGSSSQYALKEKQIILVGAGIGVAPMASLLQDIKLKKDSLKNRASGNYGASNEKAMDIGNLEKVHFFWLNRDPNCFQWFEELLMEIARTGNDTPKISVHTFTTQCIPKNDARTFMLWNGLEKMFKHQGLDPTTNLPFKTHWGRPNWDAIFDYYSNKYPGETIGLFCCGPPALSKELYGKCKHFTSLKGTKFKFHKENF